MLGGQPIPYPPLANFLYNKSAKIYKKMVNKFIGNNLKDAVFKSSQQQPGLYWVYNIIITVSIKQKM